MGRLAEGKTLSHLPALAQVRPWHRQLARAVAAGMRPREICATYGYVPCTVTKILASPLFQAEVARIEAGAEEVATSVVRDLRLMSKRSVEILDEALDTPVENWKERVNLIDTAFGVLDRAGYGKASKVVFGGEVHFKETDPQERAIMQELGREVAKRVIAGDLKRLPAPIEQEEPQE